MGVKFYEKGHKYVSTSDDTIKFTSVTTLTKSAVEPFDQEDQAIRQSKKRGGKYQGYSAEEIIKIWEAEAKRATDLGTPYHENQESILLSKPKHLVRGAEVPLVACPTINGVKNALPQTQLTPGMYPEFLVYDTALAISGQVDKMSISQDYILDIEDHKTNKEFKERGYVFAWSGKRKMCLPPVDHLEDSHSSIYALQMSLYAYLILRRNRHLKLGSLKINHVSFIKEDENEFGFPIYKTDSLTGAPIVKEVRQIELPYLQREVIALIKAHRAKQKAA